MPGLPAGLSGLFHLCEGSCLCATSPNGKTNRVLYCYGEVVLQKPSLRPVSREARKEEEEVLLLHILQIVAIAVLLLAVLCALLSIRQGVVRLRRQLRRLLLVLPPQRHDSQAELEPESPAGPPDGGTGVKDWLKQQPGRMSRSTSSYLPHNRNLLEVVEETSLLNNMT